MKDRFDLEQEVLRIKEYANNIRMTANRMIDDHNSEKVDIDFYWNALNGISILLDMHSDVMFDTMQQCFKLDSYKNSMENSGN